MVFENRNHDINDKVKGTIYRNMSRITQIEVLSVVIPNQSDLENYPYLILEIEELGGNGNGSNEWLDKSLGKLFFTEKMGKFYIHTNKINTIEKIFNTPINLNCLTICIPKPNGEIWNENNENNENTPVVENKLPLTLELKFTCIQKPFNMLNLINTSS